ncbi:MAG: hypothetical protein ABSA05_04895 [Opitutaceae bacterium]|jgi:hypothetical protein
MDVVPLTLTISLCLVFTFVIFFIREHARGGLSSAERDSLLPLADETPVRVRVRGGGGAEDGLLQDEGGPWSI